MEKNIKDFLHLYGIGFEVFFDNKRYKISELKKNTVKLERVSEVGFNRWAECYYHQLIIPLRPLDDMTEEEASVIWMLLDWNENIYPNHRKLEIIREFSVIENDVCENNNVSWKYLIAILPYLLKQSFDLFGLIESGLAFDKTKKMV